jgi:MFS family permease
MAGLYAFAPIVYPARIRTTGMGWAIGIGRFGAILAPLTVGVLLDRGWSPPSRYYAFALPLLVAIGTVLVLHRSTDVHRFSSVPGPGGSVPSPGGGARGATISQGARLTSSKR